MAIMHARPGEAVDIRPLGPRLVDVLSTCLFKAEHLEVIRLVLPKGKSMPTHDVQGEITIQCIEGSVDVTVGGRSHVLLEGHLLYLSARIPHVVVALADSSALLTIALVATRG